MDNNNKDDMSSIAHAIGELSGQIKVQHVSTLDAINVIRSDIRRIEESTKQSIQQLETRVDAKFDSLGKRVVTLEAAEKENIKASTKHGLAYSAVATALTLGFIELIKRIH
ncbi:MAG: hypothetical protein ABIU85_00175 [Methylotenera sp.]